MNAIFIPYTKMVLLTKSIMEKNSVERQTFDFLVFLCPSWLKKFNCNHIICYINPKIYFFPILWQLLIVPLNVFNRNGKKLAFYGDHYGYTCIFSTKLDTQKCSMPFFHATFGWWDHFVIWYMECDMCIYSLLC